MIRHDIHNTPNESAYSCIVKNETMKSEIFLYFVKGITFSDWDAHIRNGCENSNHNHSICNQMVRPSPDNFRLLSRLAVLPPSSCSTLKYESWSRSICYLLSRHRSKILEEYYYNFSKIIIVHIKIWLYYRCLTEVFRNYWRLFAIDIRTWWNSSNIFVLFKQLSRKW